MSRTSEPPCATFFTIMGPFVVKLRPAFIAAFVVLTWHEELERLVPTEN